MAAHGQIRRGRGTECGRCWRIGVGPTDHTIFSRPTRYSPDPLGILQTHRVFSRPTGYSPDPQGILQNAGCSHLLQHSMYPKKDCWFGTAMQQLATHEGYPRRLMPPCMLAYAWSEEVNLQSSIREILLVRCRRVRDNPNRPTPAHRRMNRCRMSACGRANDHGEAMSIGPP